MTMLARSFKALARRPNARAFSNYHPIASVSAFPVKRRFLGVLCLLRRPEKKFTVMNASSGDE